MKYRALIVATTVLGLTACGDAQDEQTAQTVDSSAFEAAIPTADALEVELEEEAAEQPAEAPSTGWDVTSFQEQAQEVAARINAARERLHAHIDDIRAETEPTEVSNEGGRCLRWEQDRERYHARLTICEADLRAQRYGFRLDGRPLDGGEEDLVVLAAGEGRVLERRNGETFVSGRMGYNFDHARSLFGTDGPTGRIAFGYRHARDAKQLQIAVDEFQPNAEAPVRSAYHRYLRVPGRGGRLTYTRVSDFLATDAGDSLVGGQDGVEEGARISLSWTTRNHARASATVCGGTVGERCVRVARCYSADPVQASWEEVLETGAGANWDEVQCPAVEFSPEDTGDSLDDEGPSTDADDIPGPDVEEPAAG